jgi:anti-sigma factor RsiW
MTPATMQCPERVAPATLAAWRDGTLSAADAAHVTAHVPTCPACRAVLSSYDTLDDALRRQPAPEPDERLWRAVQHGMHGTRRMRHASKPAQQLGGGLAALAAVVLLALGFAQVLHSRVVTTVHTSATATTATPAPQGTPTLLPTAVPASPVTNGPRPSWQQARLPVEPLTDQDILTYAVVPGHGESAYACHAISDRAGGTLTFYHTTDRALHWATLTQLKEPGVDVSDCMVQVDALDGNRVLVQVFGQNMDTFKEVVWYEVSEDGGATWTRLDESATLYGLSTWSGRTYALHLQVTDPQHATQRLSFSTDHLHTWRPVDQSLVGPYQGVTNFWLSPSGELLAEVTTWRGTPRRRPLPRDWPLARRRALHSGARPTAAHTGRSSQRPHFPVAKRCHRSSWGSP